jgi:hypothetical protein
MTWLDVIFIVFLVLGALRGLFTGKLLPLLIVFAIWIMSIALAVNFEARLGSTFGDYHWYSLIAFFIILAVIQVAVYWSGIPLMVMQSIRWRPLQWMNMAGGFFLSGCIVAIYGGLVWLVLTTIAIEVSMRSGFSVDGTGFDSKFYNLVMDSATRSALTSFIDAFQPPVGLALGLSILAVLVGLAIYGRLRGGEADAWADDEDLDEGAGGHGRDSDAASGTKSM